MKYGSSRNNVATQQVIIITETNYKKAQRALATGTTKWNVGQNTLSKSYWGIPPYIASSNRVLLEDYCQGY